MAEAFVGGRARGGTGRVVASRPVPGCAIDDALGLPNGLFPGDYFAYAAASAARAGAGAVTGFDGIFVDTPGARATRTPWDVMHARALDPAGMHRFEDSIPGHVRVEHGAIAVLAAVLLARDGLRIKKVQLIGSHIDYTLASPDGAAAGVIECAGRTSEYTSDAAAAKRDQALKSGRKPARIGIVAFGGRELRVEVVA